MQLGTQVGCTKMPFLKVAVLCCYGNNGCLFEAWGLIFIQKRRKKRVKCLFLYLKLNTILQIGTSSSNIIRLHIDSFNVSDKWNMQGFERMLSYEQYPEEKSRLCLSSFKKIDQPSCRRTTRRNFKHLPQIVCISSRFRVLYLLSWEFERSEVLWTYTVILVCHLKHVEVGWATRNYPHTGHL